MSLLQNAHQTHEMTRKTKGFFACFRGFRGSLCRLLQEPHSMCAWRGSFPYGVYFPAAAGVLSSVMPSFSSFATYFAGSFLKVAIQPLQQK